MRLQCDCMTSVAYCIPYTLIAAAGAQLRQLLIALHGVAHQPSQLRQLTEHPPKPNMVNGAFRRRELIDFLSNYKAESGDGANFKQAIWTQAAAHMSALHPNVLMLHLVQISAQVNWEGCVIINSHINLLIVIL